MTKLDRSSEKYSYHLIEVESPSFWGSGNSGFNVKELVLEFQNDKTPSRSDRYSFKLAVKE